MQDRETTGTRYHTTIFVETNADGSGVMYHVSCISIATMKTEQVKSLGAPGLLLVLFVGAGNLLEKNMLEREMASATSSQ